MFARSVDVDDLTRRVARGSGIVFAGSLVGKVIKFGLQVLLSRTLGRAAYGLYTLGVSVLQFGRQISGLGLAEGVVRFGAEAHGQQDKARLKGTVLFGLGLSVLSGGGFGIALYLGSGLLATTVFNASELTPVLQAFSVALPFYVVTHFASRVARSLQKMVADVTLGTVAQPAVNVVAVALAFALGYQLDGAVVAFLVSAVVSGALGLYLIVRLVPALLEPIRATYAPRSMMSFSIASLGTGLAFIVIEQTDRIMLGIFTTAADVGVYHAAALLATQVRFVLTAILATFTPVISDLYHRGRKADLHRLYQTTTRWIVTLSLPFALMLMLFPEPILGLYGADFRVGTGILIVLAASAFVNGGVGASGLMLRMSDYEWLAFGNEVGLAILNVILNVWLIQRFGPIGAALATGLSIALANIIKLIEVYFLLGMTPYNAAFAKPAIAGAAAAGAGWGIAALASGWALSWLAGLLTVGVAYAAILLLLGLTDEDWEILRPLLHRLGLSSPNP